MGKHVLGMLRIFDYHQWEYVKRLLRLKKHHPRRRRVRCCATPKTISFTNDAGKSPEHVDAEAEYLLGQHHIEEQKASVVKDTPQEEIDEKRVLSSHARKLEHHHAIDDEASRTNLSSTKVEEELLQRILLAPNFAIVKELGTKHDGIGKPRFTKARSFPFPDPSEPGGHYRSPSLKHKQSEVWLFPERERVKTGISELLNNQYENTGSSLNSSQSFDHHWWDHLIVKQFRGLKLRIKRALRESRKPGKVAAGDGSCSGDVKEICNDQVEEIKQQRMVRLSSLNESLDKYARLFDENLSAEPKASMLNNSKSLKLTAEDKISAPRTFRRKLSLPDHETLSSLLSDLHYDVLHSGVSSRTKSESNNSKEELKLKSETLHESSEIHKLDKWVGGKDSYSTTELGTGSVGSGINDLYADGDIRDENLVESISEAEPRSPVSVLPSLIPQDEAEQEASRPSEGLDSRPCESLVAENVHTGNEAANDLFKSQPEMVKEEERDFSFVKDIIRIGGFFESEFIEPWESMDLPLNPKVFDELESADLHGDECLEGNCIHQLMFDLINEALLDISEAQSTYFPRAFSSGRFTRPVTKGQHLLEEVWTRVKWCQGMDRGRANPTLDDIVGRDMGKGDQWMDLKWETECVALELEDMILDELIGELARS